jgi:hypothetical protein
MLAGARPVRIKPKRISPHPAESPRRRPYAVRVGDFRVTVEPKLVRGGPNFRYFAVEPTGAPFVIPPAKNAPNRHPVRQIWCICAKRYLKTRYLRRFRDRRAPGLMCLSPWSRSPGLVAGSKEAQGAPRTPCRPNADGQLGASKKKKPWPTLPHLSRRLGDPTHSRASAPQMQDSDAERRKMAALRARTAALSTTFGSPAYARPPGSFCATILREIRTAGVLPSNLQPAVSGLAPSCSSTRPSTTLRSRHESRHSRVCEDATTVLRQGHLSALPVRLLPRESCE